MTVKEAIKYLKQFADDCTLRAYEGVISGYEGEISGIVIEKDNKELGFIENEK